MQSFRRWAVCASAASDKFSDDLQVLCVSGLKSRELVHYNTVVVGMREPNVDIRDIGCRLLFPEA
jgi:hypothetical protein